MRPLAQMFLRSTFCLLPAVFFLTSPLFGGSSGKTIHSVRTKTAPVIDGYGTDTVWKSAVAFSDFLQKDPVEGAAPSRRTEIRILHDDHALYFFCMMYDDEPEKIVHRLTRRDDETQSDYLSLRIDSYHDHQTCAEFTINASGSKTDIIQFDDGNDEDASWDPVWEVKTRILENGWSAEIKIPLQILRFNTSDSLWGINILRTISRLKETDYWVMVPKKESGFISRFGHLAGLADIPAPTRLEILPFAVVGGEFLPRTAERERKVRIAPDAGADVKYGISSNFTVDLTINPDFGQVEADPEVLNLSTYETFYPEKRPFFIEGTQILRFTTFGGDYGPGLFYTRRIGKAVQADLPANAVIVDAPRAAAILGAAKLSGKTADGLSIGVLEAVTQEAAYSYRDSAGQIHRDAAEPLANYSLVRLKKDVWNNSNIGMIVTSVSRDRRHPALTGGLDWTLRLDDNRYSIDGFAAGSSTTDNRTGEAKQGSAGRLHAGKIAGEHWLYGANVDFTTPKYYINDIGYFRRPNDYGTGVSATYKEDVPGNLLRSYNFSAHQNFRWNFDGATIDNSASLTLYTLFLNYYEAQLGLTYALPVSDDRESRGFGLYNVPTRATITLHLKTDDRDAVLAEFNQTYRRDDADQRTYQGDVSLDIRATSALDFQLRCVYTRTRGLTGYVATYSDTAIFRTDLSIFGRRNIDETDLVLRGSLVFSQALTLQVYNQLFFAKGQYGNFSMLNSVSDLMPYAFPENRDFHEAALHTNVVLRWEYLPGSTLYAVWSHAQKFSGSGGFARSYDRELDAVLRTAPDNVFMLKMSYWWSL